VPNDRCREAVRALRRDAPVTRSAAALVVMARYPTPGRVKTRLARAIGANQASALYRAFVQDLDERFAVRTGAVIWAFDPPESDFPALVRAGVRCMPQVGRDLGERMHACFCLLTGEHFDRVLLLGADVPHVRDEWFAEAEAVLDQADVVLGPTDDGGYYLIGMREPHDLFSGVPMSTPCVLAETLAKAESARLRVHLLPRTFDVDEVEDLTRLRRELTLHAGQLRLPRTAACLKDLETSSGGVGL